MMKIRGEETDCSFFYVGLSFHFLARYNERKTLPVVLNLRLPFPLHLQRCLHGV